MKIKVTIEEAISKEFEIEVSSEDDAIDRGIELYRSGVLVIEDGNVASRQICCTSTGFESSWVEF